MGYRILETKDIDYKTNDLALLKYQILEKENVYYLQLKVKNIGSKIIKSFKIIYKIDDNLLDYEANYLAKPNEEFLSKNLIKISSPNFSFVGFLDVKCQVDNIKEVEDDSFGFDKDIDNTESYESFESSNVISNDNLFEDADTDSNSGSSDFNNKFEDDSHNEPETIVKSSSKNDEINSFDNIDSVNESDSFGFDDNNDSKEEINNENKPIKVKEKKVKYKKSHKGLIITLSTIFSLILVFVVVVFACNSGAGNTVRPESNVIPESSDLKPEINIFEGEYLNNNNDLLNVTNDNNFNLKYKDSYNNEHELFGKYEYDINKKMDGLVLTSNDAEFVTLTYCDVVSNNINNNTYNNLNINLDIFVKPYYSECFTELKFSLTKEILFNFGVDDVPSMNSYNDYKQFNGIKYVVQNSENEIQTTLSSIGNVYFIEDTSLINRPIIDAGKITEGLNYGEYKLQSVLSNENPILVNTKINSFYYLLEGEKIEFRKLDSSQDCVVFEGVYYAENEKGVLELGKNKSFVLLLDHYAYCEGTYSFDRYNKELGVQFKLNEDKRNNVLGIVSSTIIEEDSINIEMYICAFINDNLLTDKFVFYKKSVITDYERELRASYSDYEAINEFFYDSSSDDSTIPNLRLTSVRNIYSIKEINNGIEGEIIQVGYLEKKEYSNTYILYQLGDNELKYTSEININDFRVSIYVFDMLIEFTQHYNNL